MGELRAYVALLGGQLRSVASYRASFFLELVTNVGATAFDVFAVLILFRATRRVGGFTLTEAVLMVALTACGFALADFAVGNLDRLKQYVRTGTLDTVLVRPLGAMAQLLILDLPVRKLLRMAFGLVVYLIALRINHVAWTPGRVALAIAAPASAAVFYAAIFVLSASLAFWWVDSGEVGNAFTYGGRDFASYPVSVYGGWFRVLFAYGLGFAFVAYHPALSLLGRADPLGLPGWFGWLSPAVALLAAALAGAVWRTGLRHYRSTGS